jgi:signal transduction histidine kinase
VRARCAREAEQVRALLAGHDDTGPGPLADRLAEVVAGSAALGLTVRYRWEGPRSGLPPEVADALAEAAREALNNVAAHAGVTQAWLTAFWSGAEFTLWVVDRGRGFAAHASRYGFGLRSSVIGRMREAGGDARVTSAPGEGTCVELTWTM